MTHKTSKNGYSNVSVLNDFEKHTTGKGKVVPVDSIKVHGGGGSSVAVQPFCNGSGQHHTPTLPALRPRK